MSDPYQPSDQRTPDRFNGWNLGPRRMREQRCCLSCFGSINYMQQASCIPVAQTASSVVFVTVGSCLIPTVSKEWANTLD